MASAVYLHKVLEANKVAEPFVPIWEVHAQAFAACGPGPETSPGRQEARLRRSLRRSQAAASQRPGSQFREVAAQVLAAVD